MLGPWWGRGRDEDAVTVFDGIAAQSPGATFAAGLHDRRRGAAEQLRPRDECGSDAGLRRGGRGRAGRRPGRARARRVARAERRGRVAHARSTCPGRQEELIARDQGDRQAVRGRAVQRPAADARAASPTQSPAILEAWFPGVAGRQRGRRRAVRQGQPGRQAAGLVPARRRPGADLLQPRADRPAVRRRRRSTTRATATCRRARRCTRSATASATRRSRSRTCGSARRACRGAAGCTATVDVTNTGARAGDEVVQLYIHDPVASISQPVRRLRGFERVTLAPGETTTVTFTLDRERLRLLRQPRQVRRRAGPDRRLRGQQLGRGPDAVVHGDRMRGRAGRARPRPAGHGGALRGRRRATRRARPARAALLDRGRQGRVRHARRRSRARSGTRSTTAS